MQFGGTILFFSRSDFTVLGYGLHSKDERAHFVVITGGQTWSPKFALKNWYILQASGRERVKNIQRLVSVVQNNGSSGEMGPK